MGIDDVEGHVLRTAKLRGQALGIAVPIYSDWNLPESVDAALEQVDDVQFPASPAHRAEGVP